MQVKSVLALTLAATMASAAATAAPSDEVFFLTDCFDKKETYSGGAFYPSLSKVGGGKKPQTMGPVIGGSLHRLQPWEGKSTRLAMGGEGKFNDLPGSGIFTAKIDRDARKKNPKVTVGSGFTDHPLRKNVKYKCLRGDDKKVIFENAGYKCTAPYYCVINKA